MSKPELLVDSWVFVPTLVENKSDQNGKYIIKGEFSRADIPTENRRIYPKNLLEREVGKLAKKISERKVQMACDHPENGRTSLKDVAGLITKLEMVGNSVIGTAEVLATEAGNNIRAIIDAGGQIGVSSRGFGTTATNEHGFDVVQMNYSAHAWDFVSDPANLTSYPQLQKESSDNSQVVVTETKSDQKPEVKPELKKSGSGKYLPVSESNKMTKKMTLAELKESDKGLYESLFHSAREEAEREFEKRGAAIWARKIEQAKEATGQDLKAAFAENLKATLDATKEQIATQEREKLLNDPSVAGAKTALDALKTLLRPYIVPEDVESVVVAKEKEISDWKTRLAEAELQIASLKKENDDLAGIAKEAGFKYRLESLLQGVPQAESIRKMVGDVKLCESVADLDNKVSAAVDELTKVAKVKEERDLEIEKLKRENEKLQEAVQKSLEAINLVTVQNYAASRLTNHPKRDIAKQLIEAKAPTTKEEVDNILQGFRERKSDAHSIEEARARVRAMVGSGTVEYKRENEEEPRKKQSKALTEDNNYNELGQSVDMLRVLSGLGTDEN
jgi:hypothetical protein